MFASHFAQRCVIDGNEIPISTSGVEYEFGKYTHSAKMPKDGTIIMVIPKYRYGVGGDNFNFNPETYVIYQDMETGEYDYFIIPYYESHTQAFGFQHKPNQEMINQLRPGVDFPKDTVFTDTPANKSGHFYCYGKHLNTAVVSDPASALDGYKISRDALKHFKFKLYEDRIIMFSNSSYPLNLYGEVDNYKCFPDIGDYTREDGLIFALRKLDHILAPACMSVNDFRKEDYYFDNKTYMRQRIGKVVDVTVVKSTTANTQLPTGMSGQLQRYADAYIRFRQTFIDFERRVMADSLKGNRKGEVKFSKALHRFIVESKAITNYRINDPKQNIQLIYRREAIDGWFVKLVVEYEITPGIGYKITCKNGGKGVITSIEEPENMPVDADGNRADIITSPDSIPGRMNLGKLYEIFLNAAARDVRRELLEIIGYDRHFEGIITPEDLTKIDPDKYQHAWSRLLLYYSIVSRRTYMECVEHMTDIERTEWLSDVLSHGIINYIPIETKEGLDEIVEEYGKHFNTTYSPVTFVNKRAELVTTTNKIRIGPLYYMLLDKIADDWLASNTGKTNNFGFLSPSNKADRYETPYRDVSPRSCGETEGSLYSAYGGPELIAEIMDRNNSKTTQLEIATNILKAPEPMNVQTLIDRKKFPFGGTRPLQIAEHTFKAAGFKMVYSPEEKDDQ
jgi:hypothetical protein